MLRGLLGAGLLLTLGGCAPGWHRDSHVLVQHSIQRAVANEQLLSVRGVITPLVAFTDYGVKLSRASDDTGRSLDFRSYQIFWAKELRFELECSAPALEARSVDLDLVFLTRSGPQEVHARLPIERDVESDYTTQSRRWQSRELASESAASD